jgi:hypothetical protein
MNYNLLGFGVNIFSTYMPIDSKPALLLDLSPANVEEINLQEMETEFFSCEDRYDLGMKAK